MKRHLVVYQWIHVLALSLCLWLLLNAEPCPNSCNGHGRCTLPNRECECFDQYTGILPASYTNGSICQFDSAIILESHSTLRPGSMALSPNEMII